MASFVALMRNGCDSASSALILFEGSIDISLSNKSNGTSGITLGEREREGEINTSITTSRHTTDLLPTTFIHIKLN